MSHSSNDLAGQVRFDLDKGAVYGSNNESLALVPWELLSAITPDHSLESAARKFGRSKGEQMVARLADGDLQSLSNELASLLALMGLGQPAIEIRGDALLIRVTTGADRGITPAVQSVLCGVIGGALQSIGNAKAFKVVPLTGDSDEVVLFAGNENAAGLLRRAVTGGIPLGEALEALGRSGGEQ